MLLHFAGLPARGVRAPDGLPHVVIHSGQTLQNVLPMLELGATEVLVIHSESLRPDALVAATSAFGVRLVRSIVVPAAERSRVAAALSAERSRIRDDFPQGFVLNYTGGTKAMSTGALDALESLASSSFYMDGRRLWFHGASGDERRDFARRLGVPEVLQAHGIMDAARGPAPGIRFAIGASPTPDALAVVDAIRSHMRQFLAWSEPRRDGNGVLLPAALGDAWRLLGIREKTRAQLGRSPLAFLGSFWLEAWAYRLVTEHAHALGIDDARWGVRIVRADGTDETDLDVAFAAGNRLHFISCKAAAAEGLQDEVFEVEARRRPLGGVFATGMLLHWHDPANKGSQRAVRAARHVAVPVTVLDRSHLLDEPAFVAALKKALELRRD